MSGAKVSELAAEDWARFSSLLDTLLALDERARTGWLETLPATDQHLRPHLQAALRTERAITAARPTGSPRVQDDDRYSFAVGQRVGPYELLATLGVGGMGEVWHARRADGSLQREVALKLPHAWLMSPGQRRRLERERDFLAGLSHPNIAALYDAGISEEGQPWLALERVDGLPIDVYCRQRRLGLRERLALFAQVLGALQAAHARLIVHRDLKPANILVTDAGTVKLLDFGIAKLLDDGGSGESTELTRLTGRASTPEYAAPEQLAGAAVTTATDIYSLAVVLHELLCGQRPERGRRAGETRSASEFVYAAFAGEVGGLDARRLQRQLRGDLDAILAKALSPVPAQRYGSVEQLAEDLRRHLDSEPISARHITRAERLSRFVRRNRAALGVSALVLGVLVAGATVSLWQAQRAQAEARRANATRDFLLKVIGSSGKLQAQDRPPGSTTIREMIDSIVDGANANLQEQPETRMELLGLAKSVYRQWYSLDRAVMAHEQYRQLVEQIAGPNDPRIVESLIEQASIYRDYPLDDASLRQRAQLLDEAGRRIRAAGQDDAPLEAQRLIEVGRDAFPPVGASPLALETLRRAVDIQDRHQVRDRTRVWARFFLSCAYAINGQPAEARRVALENIAEEQAKPKGLRNDWSIAWQTTMLGHYEQALGHADAALAAFASAQAQIAATFGRDVDTYQEALAGHATLLDWRGDEAGARALYEAEAAALAAEPPETKPGEGPAWFRVAYARFLLAHGEAARALPLLEQARLTDITTIPSPYLQPDIQRSYGEALMALGRRREAGEQFKAAVEGYRHFGHPEVEGALDAQLRLAEWQLAQGEREAGEAALRALIDRASGTPSLALAEARAALAGRLRTRGDAEAARQQAQQARADLAAITAVVDPFRRKALEAQLASLEAAAPPG